MKWASSISTATSLETAAEEAASRLEERLGGEAADLVIAFVSTPHREEFERLPALVRGRLGSGVLLGCSGGGVVADGREVEQRPALGLVGAVLPDVEIKPFHIANRDVTAAAKGPEADQVLARSLGVEAGTPTHVIVLPEPFSFESEPLLALLDSALPGGRTIGGLAGGGAEPDTNALYLGASMYQSGAVGVALRGDIEIDTVVAQGCRPIGDPMFVTSSTRNVVHEIDGRRAIDALRTVYGTLDRDDKELFRHSLFMGIVMDRHRREYGRGDFLIRNLLGVDENTGALSVAAIVPENSVVQLHLRDRRTSSEDIDAMLGDYAAACGSERPAGALMFSCLGRGAGLYGHAGHDSEVLRRHLGDVPLGGFFCNGEIGEVGGRSFLHGYTSSFAMFRSATRD